MPVHSTFEQTRYALENGGFVLKETQGSSGKKVVLGVVGDITLMSALLAVDLFAKENIGVRVVSIVNPRRLFRPSDVAWDTCAEPDGGFVDDKTFDTLFGGDVVVGMTSGPASMLEPVMLRSKA